MDFRYVIRTFAIGLLVMIFNVPIVNAIQADDIDDEFANWTDEQFNHFDDSILTALYPQPIICKADSMALKLNTISSLNSNAMELSIVPDNISINTSKEVGEIVINSSTNQTGAKTYEIPINVYPGMKNFHPNIALTYNSQQNNSLLGIGWSISGLPTITRSGKNQYYDSKTEGVKMDNTDSFILDGIRLIKQSSTTDYIAYESEQGNILAKGYVSGNTMKYFEVFYPDGNKGIFGFSSGVQSLYYPLTKFTDLNGNVISYSYINSYQISKIEYNGASIEFQYSAKRIDPITSYSGGKKVYKDKLLNKIVCKFGSHVLGTYTLTYTILNDKSLITQIDYTADDKSYNPLKFYYGNGVTESSYTTSYTQLNEWYDAEKSSAIKVSKGRFDYFSGEDGIITLPNLNPYYKYYRNATALRHSRNRFDNQYKGDEKIFLYTGLSDGWVSPMPNLLTEKGFVDILCADLEGKQEEYIIKINNLVADNKDQITFHVYRSSLYTGLEKLYTRTYSFSTLYKDAKGDKSIQPKFYYPGDFDGDGKMEILAMSVHEPFKDPSQPSICYIFDLINDKILYQSHILPYTVNFIGSTQGDPQDAANKTDKLFAIDFDGDGKTDLCHIHDNGFDTYSFESTYGSWSSKKVSTSTLLKKSSLTNRDIVFGDYNGDGLMDILVTPVNGKDVSDYSWSLYSSKGDGTFEMTQFTGMRGITEDNTGFMSQDVNGDGMADLIKYDADGFLTSINKTGIFDRDMFSTKYETSNSILIPTDVNSHNCFTKLVCLKDGKAIKYSFTRDDNKEAMMTGMANSLGVIEKNEYQFINKDGIKRNVYSKGSGAIFPYVNIQEPFAVLATSSTYLNGSQIQNKRYSYTNAIIHRQGLGFRGFEKITCMDNRGLESEQVYDPCNFGILKSEKSRMFESSYTYSIDVKLNKIAKILLTSKSEKDLLKNISGTTRYTYDPYGYPREVSTTYSDGIVVLKKNLYDSNSTLGDGYNLGFLTSQEIITTNENDSYSEWMYTPSHSLRQPLLKRFYKNNTLVRTNSYEYDIHGNLTKKSIKSYSAVNSQDSIFTYDGYGRLKKLTDPLGLTNEYNYDSYGRLTSTKDYRGGTTSLEYDAVGREIKTTYPDGTIKETEYSWNSSGENGLYAITTKTTGKPTEITVYDAMNREVRSSGQRFDDSYISKDKLYDKYGNMIKESLPFKGDAPSLWNTYNYDSYDRLTSVTQASGKRTSYTYSGSKMTVVADNVSTTKEYNCIGQLISITDPAGTVNYNLSADGQPISIEAPDNVTTSFKYDSSRRRVSLTDPSLGTMTYKFNSDGNLGSETNANGQTIKYEYDTHNRLIKKILPEFSTVYTYNSTNDLESVVSDNGVSKDYSYDSFGRLSISREEIDDVFIQKEYSYTDGNITQINYATSQGKSLKEERIYKNGHFWNGRVNSALLYQLKKENEYGMPTEINNFTVNRVYEYSEFGIPVKRTASSFYKGKIFDQSYDFDIETNNLSSRKDEIRNLEEHFAYDELNRLIKHNNNVVSYSTNGNISEKSEIGTMSYENSQKPYAVTGLIPSSNYVVYNNQEIKYTSFSRPSTIIESDNTVDFLYDSDYSRVKMDLSNNDGIISHYYLGSNYEFIKNSILNKEIIYFFGDYYTSPIAMIDNNDTGDICHIIRDYMGSITQICSISGEVVQDISYDAWGRLRDPETWEPYAPGEEPELLLGRGYTGHEHLPQFGLINMNARLYDPALGRFLSPDPYVQMPEMTQNFNRYSYALNNPLKYKDPNGEFFLFTIFNAVTDFFGNMMNHGFNFGKYNWTRTVNAWKIDMGMFKGNFGQILNKWTWGIANSLVGNYVSQYYNTFGFVDHVSEMDGMLALSGATKDLSAVTIGHYSLGPKGYVADWRDNLFVHEYGHYIQTQRFGTSFFFAIGIPSLLSAGGTSHLSGMDHKERWFEVDASYLGAKYFDKKYGSGKAGYKNNENYFNIDTFINGGKSHYINPRLKKPFQDKSFKISDSRMTFWDFVL